MPPPRPDTVSDSKPLPSPPLSPGGACAGGAGGGGGGGGNVAVVIIAALFPL